MGNKSNKIADESPAVNEAGSPASGGGKEAAPVTCDKIVLLGKLIHLRVIILPPLFHLVPPVDYICLSQEGYE